MRETFTNNFYVNEVIGEVGFIVCAVTGTPLDERQNRTPPRKKGRVDAVVFVLNAATA